MADKEEDITQKSPEELEQQEQNDRVNGFIKDYGELVKKYKVDFASYPMFVPDGQGAFKILCQSTPVDISKMPVKSNFVA